MISKILTYILFANFDAFAVVDHTQYLGYFSFAVVTERGKVLVRNRPEGQTFQIKTSNQQKGVLHLSTPQKMYAEIAYSILSEAIGLPNNTKYPVFVRLINGVPHPIPYLKDFPYIKTDVIALFEQIAHFPSDTDTRLDSKMLSELIMHLSMLYLFGAEDISASDKLRFPIRLTSGERDFRSRHSIRTDHYTLTYLPSLQSQNPTQILNALLNLDLGKHFFSSSAQRDLVNYLNTYLTYLESIPSKILEELLSPLNETIRTNFSRSFREKIRHLRDLLIEYLETLRFTNEVLSDLAHPIKIKEPAHILLPQKYSKLPTTSDIHEYPIRALWNLYFEPSSQDRNALIEYFLEGASTPIQFIFEYAAKSGENFYSTTPFLSQRSMVYEHQTQLNAHRYDTLVVNPFNDQEARTIHNLTRKLGSHSFVMQVPHGYRLTLKDADHIITEAKKIYAKTVILIELPGSSPQVESQIKKAGLEVVTIDHHTNDPHSDRRNRLSSLEQFANYFGYKLSPREYITAVIDRSFIYGLVEIGLDRDEVLEILRTLHNEDYQALSDNIDIFLHARRVPYKLQNGNFINIYVVENKDGKLANVTQAAALIEFPNIANILLINRTPNGDESIMFSGQKEIADILINEFSTWRKFQNQFSGGNMRNTGYWGIRVDKHFITNHNSPVLRKIFELLGHNNRHTIRLSTAEEVQLQEKRNSILKQVMQTYTISACYSFF